MDWHNRNKRECHHVCNANTCINNNNIANRDISRPGFRKHRSNIDIHTRVACHYHLRFISTSNFVFILRDRLNLRLADPKVDDFSVYHSIRSSAVDMLCFRPVMLVRTFTVSKLVYKITGTRNVFNHFCT